MCLDNDPDTNVNAQKERGFQSLRRIKVTNESLNTGEKKSTDVQQRSQKCSLPQGEKQGVNVN